MHRALGADVDARCQWLCEDFISFATSCTEDFDCIMMSFALHHLEPAGKTKMFQEAHRLLKARCEPCPPGNQTANRLHTLSSSLFITSWCRPFVLVPPIPAKRAVQESINAMIWMEPAAQRPVAY